MGEFAFPTPQETPSVLQTDTRTKLRCVVDVHNPIAARTALTEV